MHCRGVSAFVTLHLWMLSLLTAEAASSQELMEQMSLRRPIDLVVADGRIYSANQRSGTLSVIDAETRRVLSEVAVGKRLSGLALVPGERLLLATDEGCHQLVLISTAASQPAVIDRIDVPHTPVNVVIDETRRRCIVASLWARQLTRVSLQVDRSNARQPARLVREATIDLDFAPRALLALGAGSIPGRSGPSVVVADAFGGRLAVVDFDSGRAVAELSIEGHHIRGLATLRRVDEKGRESEAAELLLTHQVLNSNTSTTHEHVFWGGVIGNRLRSLRLDRLSSLKSNEPAPGSIDLLGQSTAATGDPGAVAVTASGVTVIALSGIDEVAIRRNPQTAFKQFRVGRRPTAIALGEDGREAYVANTLDDTISVVSVEAALSVKTTIALGPPPKLSMADRGEMHFYSAKLSLDGWYSCHSCHTDGHTNGLLNDNLGDESVGAPKKILSLLGTADTSPWAWNGSVPSLEAQLAKSLRVTMQADADDVTDERIQEFKAYLATLVPPPSLDAARGRLDSTAVARGAALFRKNGCADCHAPPTYTTSGTFDVGIQDERGRREFNPPSLRGVSQRAPYFHDNRAIDLRDVLAKHGHGLKAPLPAAELDDLLKFLGSL